MDLDEVLLATTAICVVVAIVRSNHWWKLPQKPWIHDIPDRHDFHARAPYGRACKLWIIRFWCIFAKLQDFS